jgi:DNA-binding IclR family transcriptional regulator
MVIQSVERATSIISLFTASRSALGISEIASALNLNKATVWGLVTTLEKQRFLQQDPDTRKYRIGPKLLELGIVYESSLELNARAARRVRTLATRTRMDARVGIWEEGAVLITLLAMPRAADTLSHQIGPRVPAHCSGVGKALLAFLEPDELEKYLRATPLDRHTRHTITSADKLRKDLEQIRERGYSISREEMIPGLTALGAPIFGKKQQLEGAVGISGSDITERFTGWRLEKLADELLRTASLISQDMGYHGPY